MSTEEKNFFYFTRKSKFPTGKQRNFVKFRKEKKRDDESEENKILAKWN